MDKPTSQTVGLLFKTRQNKANTANHTHIYYPCEDLNMIINAIIE